MYLVTGLSYVLQQPSTAGLAKTKAVIAKKSSHSYSSRWQKTTKVKVFKALGIYNFGCSLGSDGTECAKVV